MRSIVFISMPVLRFEWLLTARRDISAILFLRDNVAIYNWQMKYAHNTDSLSTGDAAMHMHVCQADRNDKNVSF